MRDTKFVFRHPQESIMDRVLPSVAHNLRRVLLNEHAIHLRHGHALALVAQSLGHKSWHHVSSAAKTLPFTDISAKNCLLRLQKLVLTQYVVSLSPNVWEEIFGMLVTALEKPVLKSALRYIATPVSESSLQTYICYIKLHVADEEFHFDEKDPQLTGIPRNEYFGLVKPFHLHPTVDANALDELLGSAAVLSLVKRIHRGYDTDFDSQNNEVAEYTPDAYTALDALGELIDNCATLPEPEIDSNEEYFLPESTRVDAYDYFQHSDFFTEYGITEDSSSAKLQRLANTIVDDALTHEEIELDCDEVLEYLENWCTARGGEY
jgi:DNA-binding protein Fis